jgi:hypothetical protein
MQNIMKNTLDTEYLELHYFDLRVMSALKRINDMHERHSSEMFKAIEQLKSYEVDYDNKAKEITWWLRFIKFCGGEI